MRRSQHSQQNFSMWYLLLVVCMFLPRLVSSTEVCWQCRPVALQEAPGVGISLGFDQIAVAVEFANGTIINALHRNTSEDYMHAMTRLHELANLESSQDIANIAKNILIPAITKPPWYKFWARRGVQDHPIISFYLRQNLTDYSGESIAVEIKLLANELRAAFDEVAVAYGISERHVFITLPDSLANSDIQTDLRASLYHLTASYSKRTMLGQSWAASSYLYDIRSCFDEDESPGDFGDCDKYQGRRIDTTLLIDLSDNYLAMGYWQRDDGWFYKDKSQVRSFPNKGISLIESPMGSTYWTWLREQVHQLVSSCSDQIDLVALLGTGATNPTFRQVIEDIFKHNLPAIPSMKTAEEYAFAAARWEAQSAKAEMWDDGDACIPQWNCPISELMPKSLIWHNTERGNDEL